MSLEIKNISIQTDNKEVVHDVSMTLEAGTISVLMGPNGSGKSTFTNGIFGHPKYIILNGSVILEGEDIAGLVTEKKAQKGLFLSMQYLPEIGGVTLASFLHKSYVTLKNSDISILDFYTLLEKKAGELSIDSSFLNRQVNVGLSGGEKKLSEILQLAILEPKFAVLDEIDSGVDVDSLRKVFFAISQLAEKGTGFLLVTHYNAILDHITPQFVHIMKEGRLVKSGGKELVEMIVKEGFTTMVD